MSARQLDERIRRRVVGLVEDARAAREAGDYRSMRTLAEAAAVLDPGNRDVTALLVGSATRRQMTLLFCDIVGSTAMADSLDPEEVTALLAVYRRTCAEVVEEFDGHIDDHRGDGMLVLFGYPEVHEDDSRLAVACGLKIIEKLPEALRQLHSDAARRLQVRIAVHTDLVVVDGVGVAGATANEAARIQDVAAPGTVVVSDTTQALVAPWFTTESVGRVQLRGVSRLIEVFKVDRARPRWGPLADTAGASPFVGRREELERMSAVWSSHTSRSAEPGPDALLVVGPPGIGKTRFVREAVRGLGIPYRESGCSRLSSRVSLHPFRPLLDEACGIDAADGPVARLTKLRSQLGGRLEPELDLPFLASALDIGTSLLDLPRDVDPALLRLRGLQSAAALVRSLQPDGDWLLFVDDLHWADQVTLDLLGVLLTGPEPAPALVLAAREGFVPPWSGCGVGTLPLHPLGPADLADLARLAPAGATVPPARRRELVERSDGVPLFLEELLRTASVVAGGPLPHRSLRYSSYQIPPALRDPLLARLALPQVDLDVAQAAATIGRDVDPHLLRDLVGADPRNFDARLQTLVDAGLIEQAGSQVRFRHELIREVAYETQRQDVRRQRHNALADHLLANNLSRTRQVYDELAFHLEHALRFEEAIGAHLNVARADASVGSYVESTRRLTGVLALVARLPNDAQRRETELAVRELRSSCAVMAGGYAAPEAAEDYPRCVELSKATRPAREVLPYLLRSWSYYAFRGNLREADKVSEAAGRTAVEAGVLVHAQQMGDGAIAFFRGDFETAREAMERFTANSWAAHLGDRPPLDWPLPHDPLTAAYAHLVPTLWITGATAQAEVCAERARQRAARLQFPYGPFNSGYVSSLLAMTRNLDDDHEAAARIGRELIELGERHGFAMWQLTGVIQCLISAIRQGAHGLVDQLVEQVDAWRLVLAADVWTPYWLTQVGLAQVQAARHEQAVRTLDHALTVAAVTGSRFYEAETLRVRGQARVALGDPDGDQDLLHAVELARAQRARLFADRAEQSLAAAAP